MERVMDGGFISPSRKRRVASMIYEAMLLFGVVFIAGYLFDTLTQSKHALYLRHERQLWLFVVLGAYFVYFWTHGGQTLAMKTWHIKVIKSSGEPLDFITAIIRYPLALLFTMTGIAFFYSFFDKNGQFPHDRLLNTVQVSSKSKKRGKEEAMKA